MTTRTPELRALLTQARAKASEALARDPIWRALQEREADRARGLSVSAETGLRMAALEAELRSNPYLAVLASIDDALRVLAAADAAPQRPDPAPATPDTGDDLTRIRGVTPATAATMARLGITRYAHIATWTAADVRATQAALGPDALIHRQGWIEQAALLAARSAAAAKIAPATIPPAQAVTPPAPVAATAAATADAVAGTPPALATVVASALQGIIASVPASGADVPPAASLTAPPNTAATEGPADDRRPFDDRPADPPVASARPDDPVPSVRPDARAPTAAAGVADEAPVALPPAAGQPTLARTAPPPDDLRLIAHIDDATRRKLAAYGVSRFADIAKWRADDVVAHEVRLLQPLRMRREGWIEQAALLARGVETAHAERRRSGVIDALAPRPDATPWQRQPLSQTWPLGPDAAEAAAEAVSHDAASAPSATIEPQPIAPEKTAPESIEPIDRRAPHEAAAPSAIPVSEARPVPLLGGGHSAADTLEPKTVAATAAPAPAATFAVPSPTAPSSPAARQAIAPAPALPIVAPPPAPIAMPPVFAPQPGTVAKVAAAALSAVNAPPPPALAATAPATAADERMGIELADRLQSVGSDLPPGLAAALASAAAAASAFPARPPEPRRRPLADSVKPLLPPVANVDLRQWRNDTEAELGDLVDAAVAPDQNLQRSPDPAEPEAPPATSGSDHGADLGSAAPEADPGSEADVLIIARHDAAEDAAVVPPAYDEEPRGPSPADRIRARARLAGGGDRQGDRQAAAPGAEPPFKATGGGLEEASVEIVVRDGDGPPTAIVPPASQPDKSAKGLSRLVKALRRDGEDR